MNQIPDKIQAKLKKYYNKTIEPEGVYDSSTISNLGTADLIIYLEPINNIIRINKFHEDINSKLDENGIYVCSAKTLELRRKMIKNKIPKGFRFFLRIIDFGYKRVIPKLPIFKNIYFFLTKGYNRIISKPETLGRLISCGFDILEYFECDDRLYVISKKIKKPDFNMNPSYGFFLKSDRVGYKGNCIKVYKIRTMYPYSEYCQDLILKENDFSASGKIFKDYRITTWGKLFRKYWIDELPNLINFFKRDMKLIGVRPVSFKYFNKLPEELQELRVKTKPACIGIHYSTIPNSFDEVIDYEVEYLEKYLEKPFRTDLKYLIKFFYNIFFKKIRSG